MIDTLGTFWMPEAASTIAKDVDALFYFIFYISTFFFLLIIGLVTAFVLKYRRKGKEEVSSSAEGPVHNSTLEALWIGIPLAIVMVMFVWGFRDFMKMSIVPSGAMEIKVTSAKWFWSFSHPDGSESIGELVVPVNKPIRLLMSSQDVLHSFFVPAFRIKRDVLPNRYTVIWFEATREGVFPLYCAEYCGSKHSEMLGTVRVVSDEGYYAYLDTLANAGEGVPPAEFGEKLFRSKACYTCHTTDGTPNIGPSFLGVFGHDVKLADGSTVMADENYIRESILEPGAKVVAGFQPVMPTYQGRLRPRELDGLVAYIRSLSGVEQPDSNVETEATNLLESSEASDSLSSKKATD